MLEVDDIDLKILRILQENCRISIREVARRLSLSPATVYNRMLRLMKNGVIKGFTPIIDYARVGIPITAIVLASVDGKHIIDFEKYAAKEEKVIAVYDITGDFDVALICKFRSIGELDRFIKKLLQLPYVKRTVTSIALNVVKEDPRINI